MYKALIEGITTRVNDLTKFTDESYASHHNVKGRLMEASEIRNWLIASSAADEKAAAEAKASKPSKSKKKPATPVAPKEESPAPSNVTPMPKATKKAKSKPVVAAKAKANG